MVQGMVRNPIPFQQDAAIALSLVQDHMLLLYTRTVTMTAAEEAQWHKVHDVLLADWREASKRLRMATGHAKLREYYT